MRPVTFASPSSGWRSSLAVIVLAAGLAACGDAPSTGVVSPAPTPGAAPVAALTSVQASGAATNIGLASAPTVCLAVRGGLVDDTYIQTSSCNTSSALQRFTLTSAGQLRSASDARWCIDIGGQRGYEGDPLVLGTCAGVTSQRWSVTASHELKSRLATGRCVTAAGSIGSAARVRNCGASPAQQRWTDVGATGGTTQTPTTPTTPTTPPTPPAPVATVAVTLASGSLTVGQATQATATLRDASGNVVTGRAVAWTTSNAAVATVSASGVVTAAGAGSASITASSEGRSGSASLAVQAVTPPPTGASPDTIFKDGFESGTLSLWQDGVDPSKHRVVSTGAHGGTRALEITTAGGDGGWLTRFFMPGYDSAYVSFWVRYGAEWQGGSKLLSFRGSRIDNQWSGFGNAGRCPSGTDFFSGNVVTDGGASATAPGLLRLYSYYPAMPRSGTSCWGDLGTGRGASYLESASSPALAPGTTWHRVEYFFRLNTPGQANAEQYLWVDGRRVASWTGISFRTTTDLRVNSVQLNISGATGTQRVYFDDLVVLKGRPAGLP